MKSKIVQAAENGDVLTVKMLIKTSQRLENLSSALRHAAEHGHAECVRLLIPVSDPKAECSQAIFLASMNGHVECVKLLIPVSDHKAGGSYALRQAAFHGHAECVRILIPVSCEFGISSAIVQSICGDSLDCVRELLPFCGKDMTLKQLELLGADAECSQFVMDYYRMIDEQRELGELVEACAGAIKKSTRL